MRRLGVIVRALIMALLLSMAVVFCAVSFSVFASRDARSSWMRENADRYRATGSFVALVRSRDGRYPSTPEIRAWAAQQGYDDHWAENIEGNEVGGSSVACLLEDDFSVPSTDTFILSRWRGEWFDCYSLPSGTNNIAYTTEGEWQGHALFWGLAVALVASGWWIRPRRRDN